MQVKTWPMSIYFQAISWLEEICTWWRGLAVQRSGHSLHRWSGWPGHDLVLSHILQSLNPGFGLTARVCSISDGREQACRQAGQAQPKQQRRPAVQQPRLLADDPGRSGTCRWQQTLWQCHNVFRHSLSLDSTRYESKSNPLTTL